MGVCREVEYNEPDLVTVAMTYSNEGQYITSNKWININAIDVIHAESFRQSWQGIEKESREWEKFHLFLIGRGTFPRQINTWSLRMRSCTAQKGKMKKQWLKKKSNKQTTKTYWTCPSQGLNAVHRIAPMLISQAPTLVAITVVNCRKDMQECFYIWCASM